MHPRFSTRPGPPAPNTACTAAGTAMAAAAAWSPLRHALTNVPGRVRRRSRPGRSDLWWRSVGSRRGRRRGRRGWRLAGRGRRRGRGRVARARDECGHRHQGRDEGQNAARHQSNIGSPRAPSRPRPHGSGPEQSLSRGRRSVRDAVARPPRSRVPQHPRRDVRTSAPGLPDRERVDLADQRHRVGRHGGRFRQRRRARRRRGRSASTASSASACATSPSRCGAEVVVVREEWGRADRSRSGCSTAHPSPKVIALVHAETSTGVRNDVEPLGQRQGRRAPVGRLRHVARRHPRRHRRMGCRHRVQRHAEVPRRSARAGSAHGESAGHRPVRRAQPELVPRPAHDRQVRVGQRIGSHLPPHRADWR